MLKMNKSGKTKYCLALLSGILALNSCQSNRVQEKEEEEEEKKKYNILFIS